MIDLSTATTVEITAATARLLEVEKIGKAKNKAEAIARYERALKQVEAAEATERAALGLGDGPGHVSSQPDVDEPVHFTALIKDGDRAPTEAEVELLRSGEIDQLAPVEQPKRERKSLASRIAAVPAQSPERAAAISGKRSKYSTPKPGSKFDTILKLMRREGGACEADVVKATGWAQCKDMRQIGEGAGYRVVITKDAKGFRWFEALAEGEQPVRG